jgi:hypothetical protein
VIAVLVAGAGADGPGGVARAINLHLSDLPGYEVASRDQGLGASILPAGLKSEGLSACRRFASSGRVGEVGAGSPWFRLSTGLAGEAVMSAVNIEPSARTAVGDLRDVRSRTALACFAGAFAVGAKVGSVSVPSQRSSRVHIRRLATARNGADGSFGLRFVLPITVRGVSLKVDVDWRGYRVGRDELSLMTFALQHPFVGTAERELSTLMIGRARALPH